MQEYIYNVIWTFFLPPFCLAEPIPDNLHATNIFVDLVAWCTLPSGEVHHIAYARRIQSYRCLCRSRENLRYLTLTHWSNNLNSSSSRQLAPTSRHPLRKDAQTAKSGKVKGLCCNERRILREGNAKERASVVGAFGHILVHVNTRYAFTTYQSGARLVWSGCRQLLRRASK